MTSLWAAITSKRRLGHPNQLYFPECVRIPWVLTLNKLKIFVYGAFYQKKFRSIGPLSDTFLDSRDEIFQRIYFLNVLIKPVHLRYSNLLWSFFLLLRPSGTLWTEEALPKKVAWKYMFPPLCQMLHRVVERLRDSLEIEYQEASC